MIGAGALTIRTHFANTLTGMFAGPEPVISSIRYTLEIEVQGKRYTATSVVQTYVYEKSEWAFEIGQKYVYRHRGEGLGIRLDDGRAIAVKLRSLKTPPDYKPYDKDVVLRFASEQKSFPIDLRPVGSGPPQAVVFDDAVAPSQGWRFDWLHPERTLGRGARIARFDMTPTRDPPTFDLGKAVPRVVVDRRKNRQQMIPGDEDVWFGFDAVRARLKNPNPLDETKEVVLSEETHQTKWVDATDRFSGGGMWSLVTEVEPIDVRYSSDFGTITLLVDDKPTVAPTLFVQRERVKRRNPANPVEQWAPIVCILHTGCADILPRPSGLSKTTGALIDPATEDVYIARGDAFTTANTEFQKDEIAEMNGRPH